MKPLLRNPWLLVALFAVALQCATVHLSQARPGGGHSSKGGGGHHSGGSKGSKGGMGGSGGNGIGGQWGKAIITLTVERPYVMVPIYVVLLAGLYIFIQRLNKRVIVVNTRNAQRKMRLREHLVHTYQTRDPNFSEPLFLDFANALYHEYYSKLGTPGMAQLQPYLPDETFGQLQAQAGETYSDIVISSFHIGTIITDQNGWDLITVYYYANLTGDHNGKLTRYYREERWNFSRRTGVLSLEPHKLHSLSCVSCAAPLNLNSQGACTACGHKTQPGTEQWAIAKIQVNINQVQGNPRGKMLVYEKEMGTDNPTIVSDSLRKGASRLMAAEGNAVWGTYEQAFFDDVVRPCFTLLYQAWSARKWEAVRPIVSDRLFESQKMWMDEYLRQKLVNRLDNITIQNIETARVDVDKFYAAITVRISAKCLDYVTDESGKVLAGSAKRPRVFAEYWTFVKNAAVKSGDKPSATTKSCPSCGAEVKINLAGKCDYCSAKVTDGSFNWVLTRIEQDDTYGY